MRRICASLLYLFLTVLFQGCGGDKEIPPAGNQADAPETGGSSTSVAEGSSTQPPAGESPQGAASTPAAPAATKPMQPVRTIARRETLTGNWLLYDFRIVPPQQKDQLPQFGERALLLCTLNADNQSGLPLIAPVAGRFGFEHLKIKDATFVDNLLQFEAVGPADQKEFHFRGRFQDGLVVGSMVMANGTGVFVRMIPTEERTFARIPVMDPVPEAAEMLRLSNSPIFDADARDLIAANPVSPINRLIWSRLLELALAKKPKADELEKLIAESAESQGKMDQRLATIAEYEALSSLIMQGHDVDWCAARVDHVEKLVSADPTLEPFKTQLAAMRLNLRYRKAFTLLSAPEKEKVAEGRKLANELLIDAPYNPQLLVRAADAARESGEIDEAIRLYSHVAVLPLLERMLQEQWAKDPIKHVLPSERLAALWQEKHGKSDGLDEHLQTVYQEQLLKFADPPVEKRPNEGTHTVLVEFFTGARSPACVAPEVGLSAVEKTYPSSMVIVLRYHLHIPGPDPLASEDAEARFFNYYRTDGTPNLLLDGEPLVNSAGVLDGAPTLYRNILPLVEQRSAAKTDAKVEVTAVRTDDKVQVKASVVGIDFKNSQLRLRLALAESDIRFQSLIGIRQHSMVVRSLIGGDQGVAPAGDALEYEGEVSLDELRERLHRGLTQLEKNQGATFDTIPLELKNLSVVAFVQDDSNRQVLQTVVVPVSQ